MSAVIEEARQLRQLMQRASRLPSSASSPARRNPSSLRVLALGAVPLVSILDQFSEFLDWVPFLCCLAVSRAMKEGLTMMRQHCKLDNASMYVMKVVWRNDMKAAAALANRMICWDKWTPDDPRCCARQCRYRGKTGLWLPRSAHYSKAKARALNKKKSWFMDQPLFRYTYPTGDPQQTIQQWQIRGRRPKIFVVCSESCGSSVCKALRAIDWHNSRGGVASESLRDGSWAVCIGVDFGTECHLPESDSDYTPSADSDEDNDDES